MRFTVLFILLSTWLFTATAWSAPLFPNDGVPTSARSNPISDPASRSPIPQEHQQFLPVDQAFKVHAWREGNKAWIGIEIHPGYYLYRKRIHLVAHDKQSGLGAPQLPVGEFKADRFMGDVSIYHGRLLFSTPILASSADTIKVDFSYQGCAEAGLCYAPEHRTLSLQTGTRPAVFDTPLPPVSAVPEHEDIQLSSTESSQLSAWQLSVLFLAGIGLVFTPCVLPMLPIISALVVGQTRSTRRTLLLSSSYVAGMLLSYAAMGLVIGLVGVGLNIQARLQSPWVVIPFALFFVLLALWTKEWLRFPNLGISQHATTWEHRFRHMGPGGLFVAGAVSTLIVSPCLSAPLAGVLTYISTTGNAWGGALSLLTLGLGMGIPLILVCVFGAGILPKRGAWMERVRNICALALLGVALWLVEEWLPGSLLLAAWGMLGIAGAFYLGIHERRAPLLVRALALTVGVWSLSCIAGAAMGHNNPWHPLKGNIDTVSAESPPFHTITTLRQLDDSIQRITQTKRPILLDLYADWCVSCKQMEATMFSQASVKSKLAHFELIRFDLTNDSTDARELLKRYSLFGPPSLLFFDAGGERTELRIQGEPSKQQLVSSLSRAQRALSVE